MKNEELDRLFQQKFEQLEAQPTPQAWKQLEEQLQHKKKQKTGLYLSGIAASLLLLLGIWGSLEYSSTLIPTAPVAQEQEKAPTSPEAVQESQVQPKEQVPAPLPMVKEENLNEENATRQQAGNSAKTDKSVQLAENTAAQEPVKSQKQKPMAVSLPEEKQAQAPILPQIEPRTELSSSLAAASTEISADIRSQSPALLSEQVIIRYQADPAEPKPAEEPRPAAEELAKADSKEISASKVMGFFKKVKESSNGSLAELREAKDDLLSLRISRAN